MELTATVTFEADEYVLGHYIADLKGRKAGSCRADLDWHDEMIAKAEALKPDADDLFEWLLLGQVFTGRDGNLYTGADDILEEVLDARDR